MDTDILNDYRWLVGENGRCALADAAQYSGSYVALSKRLRKSITQQRTHLVLEQLELRRRAAVKFSLADQMFFTRRSLEQATDEAIARKKAQRFEPGTLVADLCCGTGGDLLGLAEQCRVVGIDRDPVLSLLAESNSKALGLPIEGVCSDDVSDVDLSGFRAWHIDPDRRVSRRRTSAPELSEPSIEQVVAMLDYCPNAGIKLAPAAELPDSLAETAEREWYGSRRECRQQVVWLGDLAQSPGRHSATVVGPGESRASTVVGEAGVPLAMSDCLKRFLHEPHAAVLAADLSGALARERDFLGLSRGIAYLTSDDATWDPLWDSFEIIEAMPLDMKRIRSFLRESDMSVLEVKKRGVSIDPAQVRKQLGSVGKTGVSLLAFLWHASAHAVIARRMV